MTPRQRRKQRRYEEELRMRIIVLDARVQELQTELERQNNPLAAAQRAQSAGIIGNSQIGSPLGGIFGGLFR